MTRTAWTAFVLAMLTPGVALAQPPSAPPGQCSTGAAVLRAYSETELSRQDAAQALDIRSGPGGEMSVQAASRATGACAAQLSGFHGFARFFGPTGDVGVVQSIDAWVPSTPWTLGRFIDMRSDAPHPDLIVPATFVMASRLSREPVPAGRSDFYVGLWRRPAGAIVAVFRRNADGSFTSPEPLLISTRQIRSITHFQADYDPLYGAIHLVQDDGAAGEARLVWLSWRRPVTLSGYRLVPAPPS